MSEPDYTRCRWCGYHWMGLPLGWQEHRRRGDRLPGMGEGLDLRCPQCGLGGSAIVMDLSGQLPLDPHPPIDPTVYKYQSKS